MPGRAVVLLIESLMASRPFGLPSLTPPGDRLVSPSPPRGAWRPWKPPNRRAWSTGRGGGYAVGLTFRRWVHRPLAGRRGWPSRLLRQPLQG